MADASDDSDDFASSDEEMPQAAAPKATPSALAMPFSPTRVER